MEMQLVLFVICAGVVGAGLLMDRENFKPVYLLEYTALAAPLALSYVADGTAGLLSMVALYAILLMLLYTLARLDWHATFVPSGEIKFITRGEEVDRILASIPGHRLTHDGHRWVLSKGDVETNYQAFFTRWFGIHWVSILFPLKRVHIYRFRYSHLYTGTKPEEREGRTLQKVGGEGEYYIEHRDEPVDSLYYRYVYPVLADEVELKGNLRVNVLVLITIETRYPFEPVFIYKGNWLDPVFSAVRGAITDFCRGKNLEKFREAPKEDDGGEFDKGIKGLSKRLLETVGVEIVQVDFVKYDLAARHEEEQKAFTAREVARLNAEGREQEGLGEEKFLAAQARGLRAFVEAANAHPQGAAIIAAIQRKEGLTNFRGQVLSEGGGVGMPVIVDTRPPPAGKKKEDEGVVK